MRRPGAARKGGKSAVLAPNDLEYGLAVMFRILSDKDGFPFGIGVFRSHKETGQWLFDGNADLGNLGTNE